VPANTVRLDHLVYGVPDLLDGVTRFFATTGVEPVAGGRHPGRGTANYLVGLGAAAYLEIIGPDPAAPDPERPRAFGVDGIRQPRLLTWCVRPGDLDACIAVARSRGYDPGDATEMSRRSVTGELLRWRLTPDTITDTGGTVPFLIDWAQSRHPTASVLPQLELAAFTLHSPDPARISERLSALGFASAVDPAGVPGLTAVLRTSNGTVTLR
jgi:hypothetical protein